MSIVRKGEDKIIEHKLPKMVKDRPRGLLEILYRTQLMLFNMIFIVVVLCSLVIGLIRDSIVKIKVLYQSWFPKTTKFTSYHTCCKTKNPDICDLHRKVKFAGQSFDGIYTEGCIPRLQRYFEDNMIIMVGIGIGVGIIQVLGLIFSMALCCAIRSE
ncbi:tetraspanin-8 [Trichonephila inaurata madagascariensis]|uniref:Tetraspanin-8 n=1 Tax=Trichonephila inaurata madagascariensis TaxID=2747483 RepID=A0A8X7CRU1_9ARAC|nr:tetraspanin-8 [Trichonephila inaurata madagascariensis]